MNLLATSPTPPLGLILGCLLIFTACSRVSPEQTQTQDAPDPPLVLLAERGDFPAIDALLAAGAAPDPVDGCHWTPLMKAALKGHLATARRLLDAGADPNAEDKGGYSALMLAASRGHGDLVRLLIERGADVDRQERDAGWSALLWAAKDGRRNSVAILLSQGANPHLQDVNGRYARDWARENGHKDILELLTALPPGSP